MHKLNFIAGWSFEKFHHVEDAAFTRLSGEEMRVEMMTTEAYVGEARLGGGGWLRGISFYYLINIVFRPRDCGTAQLRHLQPVS